VLEGAKKDLQGSLGCEACAGRWNHVEVSCLDCVSRRGEQALIVNRSLGIVEALPRTRCFRVATMSKLQRFGTTDLAQDVNAPKDDCRLHTIWTEWLCLPGRCFRHEAAWNTLIEPRGLQRAAQRTRVRRVHQWFNGSGWVERRCAAVEGQRSFARPDDVHGDQQKVFDVALWPIGVSLTAATHNLHRWSLGAGRRVIASPMPRQGGNGYGRMVQAPANGSTAVSYAQIAKDTQPACQLHSYLFFWDFVLPVIRVSFCSDKTLGHKRTVVLKKFSGFLDSSQYDSTLVVHSRCCSIVLGHGRPHLDGPFVSLVIGGLLGGVGGYRSIVWGRALLWATQVMSRICGGVREAKLGALGILAVSVVALTMS
jgi:hypothetical protein